MARTAWVHVGILCLPLLIPSPGAGDVIHLRDGGRIEAPAWYEAGDAIEIERFGGVVRIPKSDVLRIEPSEPEPETPATDATVGRAVDELLDVSGARRQLAELPGQILAGAEERQADVDPAHQALITGILRQTFTADALQRRVRGLVASRYDARHAAAVMTWLRSPLGRKLTRLEVEAATPQAAEQIRQYAGRPAQTPVAPPRLALVRRLDAASGSSVLGVDIIVGVFESMARVVSPMLPSEKRLRPGQLEQLAHDVRTRVGPAVQDEVLLTFLYTYRSVSDAELARYATHLESDAGRWFSAAMREAILGAITGLTREAMSEIARRLLRA